MKTTVLLVFILLLAPRAHADCTGWGLTVLPASGTITENSVFIVEGYAMADKVIYALNSKHRIYLQDGKNKIGLNVIEICRGDYFLIQAILKPVSILQQGRTYTLVIDSCNLFDVYIKFDQKQHPSGKVTYKVNGYDCISPFIANSPEIIEKTFKQYGCGPETFVIFNTPFNNEPGIYVRVKLKNLKTGKETVYYLQPHDSKIYLGHNMCSGAFDFEGGKYFEAQFQLMDPSGNYSAKSGWVSFAKPQAKDYFGKVIH